MSALAVTVEHHQVVVRVDPKTARRLATAWSLMNADPNYPVPDGDERWHDDVVDLLHAAIVADPVNQPVPVLVGTQVPPMVPATNGGQ